MRQSTSSSKRQRLHDQPQLQAAGAANHHTGELLRIIPKDILSMVLDLLPPIGSTKSVCHTFNALMPSSFAAMVSFDKCFRPEEDVFGPNIALEHALISLNKQPRIWIARSMDHQFGPSNMMELPTCENLRCLDVHNGIFTSDFKKLIDVAPIRSLSINGCQFSERALQLLAGMRHMVHLSMYDTSFGDEHLHHIVGCELLKEVCVDPTVTANGIDRIRRFMSSSGCTFKLALTAPR